jgi:hypothetical protein
MKTCVAKTGTLSILFFNLFAKLESVGASQAGGYSEEQQ